MRSNLARALAGFAAVASLSSCNAMLAPATPDTHWTIVNHDRFSFYVRPGSFAEQSLDTLSDVLNDQFTSTVNALGLRYDGHIAMFLYNSGADAGFGNDPGSGDHSGVAYPATETVKTVCIPPLDANLFSLVSHEANHVIVRNGLGREGTTFVNEGLASALLSERYHSQGRTFYYHWTATHHGQFPRIGDLVDDGKWNTYSQPVSYSTSASFLAYLLETYGAAPMKLIYRASSAEFATVFQGAYGLSLDAAETQWLAFCDARG